MTVDTEQLRRTIDLRAMVEQMTGQQIVKNKIRCPFHADETPSLHIYDDMHFRCFGCGKHGDWVDFTGYVLYGEAYDPHIHFHEIVDRQADILGDIHTLPPHTRPAKKAQLVLNPAIETRFAENFGKSELEYWREQGITAKAIYALNIGYTGDRWAFPWHYRGVLTAIKLRRDDRVAPDLEPKYTSTTGSRFAAPFNIDQVLETLPRVVLIVEDEKSVLAAMTHDIAAISTPANSFKLEWVHLLSSVERVIVVADNDAPGLASAEKIRRMMPGATVTVPPIGKDMFDYCVYLRQAVGDKDVAGIAIRDWLEL